MKIPGRCQRAAKNQTIAETLPNHSIQPIEGKGVLHKGSNPKAHSQPQLNIGDAVLVRDLAREQFRPRYKDYCVTKRLGNARVEVCDNHGKLSV